MFEHAIKAKFPAIVVQTDDIFYLPTVLQAYLPKKVPVLEFTKNSNLTLGNALYYTQDQSLLTQKTVSDARDLERTIVFVNCKANGLAFDAGMLLPTDATINALLAEYVPDSRVPIVRRTVRGLSLKVTEEILQLTAAKTGGLNDQDIRYTRSMLTPMGNGLYPVETATDFYQPSPELAKWVAAQKLYMLDLKAPHFMAPRGVMLAGPPGVGKTMGAKFIAKTWGLPLYRLDIATTLTRWLGDAEARIAASLQTLDKEEPCVVLLDEVEKVFKQGDSDNAAIERMLSQLLWWLQEHTSRVLVVMTTNNLQAIPPELYREGRIDLTLHMPPLTPSEAEVLANSMLNALLHHANISHVNKMSKFLKSLAPHKQTFSHAEVRKMVVERIKEEGWKVKS